MTIVDLHMRAELSAYDQEGFKDRSQAAEIGALRAVDLADDAKTLTNRMPDLLILDEPTSEMDARGEHMIFRALREMAPGRITLVVTHRLDRIREEGTFDELVNTDGSLLGELYALSQDR